MIISTGRHVWARTASRTRLSEARESWARMTATTPCVLSALRLEQAELRRHGDDPRQVETDRAEEGPVLGLGAFTARGRDEHVEIARRHPSVLRTRLHAARE